MPKRKSVPLLHRLCLENIAENMHLLWTKDYKDNYLDEYQFRYIMGPFTELAGSLVQELLKLMREKRRLTRAGLHLLVVPQLTELDLTACSRLVNKTITQMVAARCKNLSTLYLQGCSRIPADVLVDLVEGLPCLKKLDLSETQCNTQVLSAVGSCCRQLCELDISDCKKLSPASLLHLAYDPTVGAYCCPALRLLWVDGLCPTAHSQDLCWSLAFLLLALPSLRSLENEFVPEALGLLQEQQFKGAPVTPGFPSLEEVAQGRVAACAGKARSWLTLPLREMIEVQDHTLPVVSAMCPDLEKVAVTLDEDGPLPSRSFLLWRHLTHLTLDNAKVRALRELFPVVASLGGQLQALSLAGFSADDELAFHTLLGHCPNLRSLSASLLYTARPRRGAEAAPSPAASLAALAFPALCEFSLLLSDLHDGPPSRQAGTLSASLVSLLRSAPCLEALHLVEVPVCLDEVFEAVLEPRGAALARLRDLCLGHCKVSSRTIHLLLSSENLLSSLRLERCLDIHRKDYDKLLRRVSKEGFELQVHWE